MSLSSQVRDLFYHRYIVPARIHGQSQISVAASDISRQFGWSGRFPLICGALAARSFHNELGVELLSASSPCPSSTTVFTFRLNGSRAVTLRAKLKWWLRAGCNRFSPGSELNAATVPDAEFRRL